MIYGISNLDISYHVTEKETGYFAGSGNTHFCISCGARVTRLGDDTFVIYNNELGDFEKRYLYDVDQLVSGCKYNFYTL